MRERVRRVHPHALALPLSCPTRLHLPGLFRAFLLQRHLPMFVVKTEEGRKVLGGEAAVFFCLPRNAVRPSGPLARPPARQPVLPEDFTRHQPNFGDLATTRDGDSVFDMQTAHNLG